MTSILRTEELTKKYGRHRGVVDLGLEVEPGEVFGFLGPNGAGKTTTIRILLDLIRPTTGRALVFGLDSRSGSGEIRRRTGYLPGELSLYDRLTGEQTIRFFAGLRGGVDREYVQSLVERLEFEPGKKVADLSTGNKRKLGLIEAFMHRPELLILDEPTSGLDPLVQHEFYEMVAEARDRGQTMFISSHVLPEVQRICHRVGFIREGRLIAVEDVAALTGRAVREIEAVFAEPVSPQAFAGIDGLTVSAANSHSMRLTVTGSIDPVLKRLAQFDVVDMTSREPDLEDVFMTLYGGNGTTVAQRAAGAAAQASADTDGRAAAGGHGAAEAAARAAAPNAKTASEPSGGSHHEA